MRVDGRKSSAVVKDLIVGFKAPRRRIQFIIFCQKLCRQGVQQNKASKALDVCTYSKRTYNLQPKHRPFSHKSSQKINKAGLSLDVYALDEYFRVVYIATAHLNHD